jgi:predicted CXXCH cytochrome family protein
MAGAFPGYFFEVWLDRPLGIDSMARKRRKPQPTKPGGSSTSAPSADGSKHARPLPAAQGSSTARRALWTAATAGAAIVAGALIYALNAVDLNLGHPPAGSGAGATFVGSAACASCHQAETQLWQSSQHKLAMDHATDKSVLGDFSDARFDYHGVQSRFFRRSGKFYVETDGPDGKPAVFEIKYTFGLEPLQQYLIEFSDGRLQALSIAWDNRPKAEGGQRWFHLYPDENIRHDDILHWTKLNQNWNFMCAECHSTGVRKNYDAGHDRFATTWADINVGCEACHGQGSGHVAWARSHESWWPFGRSDDPDQGLLARFDERKNASWPVNPTTGHPQRSVMLAALRKEVETCGRCHARRGQFSEDWIPGRWLSNTHAVSPLARGLYHADGQMLDEVYNYGSFKQSKMFAAGVTCSDCHDPHSAQLRVSGDGTCLQCHSAEKYAAVMHHRHPGVTPQIACVSCHMPSRTYMVIDRRHDHSFRVPRPDLSLKLATPNACNDCHTDRSFEWAAAAVASWHGPERGGFQSYTDAFHAAWTDKADAATLLAEVAARDDAPAFARASALSELATRLSPANIEVARKGLGDADPMVRISALDMLENVDPTVSWRLAAPLLSDPSRGVRIRAVSLLAAVPTATQLPAGRELFDRAAAEFVTAQRLNSDRPESRSMLGHFYAQRGLAAEAEAEYQAARRLGPQYTPAAINLADLYRQLGRDQEGESVLRAAITVSPRDADVHHALGLVLVRLKRPVEALTELRQAAELGPERARHAYVYAVALHSVGRTGEAMSVLEENVKRHPNDRDTLLSLVSFSRDAGNIGPALTYAERLARLAPDDQEIAGLVDALRRELSDR